MVNSKKFLGALGATLVAGAAYVGWFASENKTSEETPLAGVDDQKAAEFILVNRNYRREDAVDLTVNMNTKEISEYIHGTGMTNAYASLFQSVNRSFLYDGHNRAFYNTPLFLSPKQKERRAILMSAFDKIAEKLPAGYQSAMAVECHKPAGDNLFACKVKGG